MTTKQHILPISYVKFYSGARDTGDHRGCIDHDYSCMKQKNNNSFQNARNTSGINIIVEQLLAD